MDGKKRFCPLLGLRPKGGAARHPCSIVLNMAAPHTWERFGCQTIDSILLPDTRQSAPFVRAQEVLRNAFGIRGGRNSLPAIKESRHFAACRETGIFPAKVAFSA